MRKSRTPGSVEGPVWQQAGLLDRYYSLTRAYMAFLLTKTMFLRIVASEIIEGMTNPRSSRAVFFDDIDGHQLLQPTNSFHGIC